jgi:hypothetical protein
MLRSIVMFCLCLGLAGCESLSERVQERFADVPPQTRLYTADARTAYFAAQLAFKRLDFRLTRTFAGHVEAASQIHHSEAFGDSRQLVALVKVRDAGQGQAEVALSLSEQVENASLGGQSEQALRDHGFFDTYFATVQMVLNDGSAAEAAKNN